MSHPNIELHIDTLILRNFPYAQRKQIAAAVEQELLRLVHEQGVPPELAQGGYVPHLNVNSLTLSADAPADTTGTSIAQAVYHQLSRAFSQG